MFIQKLVQIVQMVIKGKTARLEFDIWLQIDIASLELLFS